MKYKFTTDPASDADIVALESELQHDLPDDYRDFLRSVNGGRPERRRFAPNWAGQDYAKRYDLSTASELFGLRDDEGLDLRDEITSFRERIPSNTIPVGRDPGGNLILMALDHERRGQIFFWAMEQEVDFEGGVTPDFSNVATVASSFTTFLAALEMDD